MTISVIREHARQHFSKLEEKQQSKEKRISDEIQEKGSSVLKDEIVEPDQLQANQKYENGLRILEGKCVEPWTVRCIEFDLSYSQNTLVNTSLSAPMKDFCDGPSHASLTDCSLSQVWRLLGCVP